MKAARLLAVICLAWFCSGGAHAQESSPPETPEIPSDQNPALKHRVNVDPTSARPPVKQTIQLGVPAGASLEVVIDQEIRVRGIGQAIHGHLVEPVYTFDKLYLPAGTEVHGQISQMESISTNRRVFAALDANFTPTRKITVEFTELLSADGKHIPIQTTVAPGSGQVIRFVTAAENKKKNIKDAISVKEKQAKQEARRQFDAAMKQVQQPGRFHRLQRYAVDQLPVHPQYIDAGTTFIAELEKPLQFEKETLTEDAAAALSTEIPEGTMVHAELMTPLNSASTAKGAEVEAMITRPLLVDGKLVLPQGSLLKGNVLQVHPARYRKHNGQLRFVFRDLVMPDGLQSKVEAMLQGVQSATADNLQLDAEGGAEPKTSNTRYLRTGIAVGLAAATHENEASNRAQGGAGGFKVVGIVIGASVHSQPLAIAMGAFGACRSIYSNFIARGSEIVFAKHTAMEIGIDTRSAGSKPAADNVDSKHPAN